MSLSKSFLHAIARMNIVFAVPVSSVRVVPTPSVLMRSFAFAPSLPFGWWSFLPLSISSYDFAASWSFLTFEADEFPKPVLVCMKEKSP